MVVETGYVAGSGLLLGSGERWLLLTDPRDEDVVAALWSALGRHPAPGESGSAEQVLEQVLAIVEKAFDGDPPALAYVDLAPTSSATVSRGSGHVRVVGPARVLSLDAGRDPETLVRTRRLIGGVVAADRAEVRPVSAPVAPSPTPAPAARPTGSLIDGVPQAILDARGPDGPPPLRPRLAPGSTRDPEHTGPGTTSDPEPAAEHALEPADAAGPTDAVGTADAGEPAVPAEPAPEPLADTGIVSRPVTADPGGPGDSDHLRSPGDDTVLAVHCPLGHPTPPDQPACRACHQPVAPQEPQRIRRPTLGGLRLPTGEVVPLDRGVVLGRRPAPVPGASDWPHLVHLPPDHAYVSRMHLQIELDGWHVVARDLGSRGGTVLRVPGRPDQPMRPHEGYVLAPGTSLDLAEAYEVRFETGAVARR